MPTPSLKVTCDGITGCESHDNNNNNNNNNDNNLPSHSDDIIHSNVGDVNINNNNINNIDNNNSNNDNDKIIAKIGGGAIGKQALTVAYADNECWSASIAVLVAAACQFISTNKLTTCANETLRNFLDAEWVKDAGADFITKTFCERYGGTPNDAIPAMVKVGNNLTLTTDGKTLSHFVGWGKDRPCVARALGGLRFEKGIAGTTGHWTAVVRARSSWWCVDGDESQEMRELTGKGVCYWVYSLKLGPLLGGTKQLLPTKKALQIPTKQTTLPLNTKQGTAPRHTR